MGSRQEITIMAQEAVVMVMVMEMRVIMMVTLGSREERTMTAQEAVVRAHQRAAAREEK